jgi:hypothetical protein
MPIAMIFGVFERFYIAHNSLKHAFHEFQFPLHALSFSISNFGVKFISFFESFNTPDFVNI